jgi:hypothetical protein
MVKAALLLTLIAMLLPADEPADRNAIVKTVAALNNRAVRAAEIVTADFDGELIQLPEARPWCELDCPRISVGSVRFITADVAIAEGVVSGEGFPNSGFLAVLRKDGSQWRIASMRRVAPVNRVVVR